MVDGFAGHDPKYRKKIRIICSRPYHALFMKQMLIRDTKAALSDEFRQGGPDFTILNAGEYAADPLTEGVTSKTSVNISFTDKEAVILGT